MFWAFFWALVAGCVTWVGRRTPARAVGTALIISSIVTTWGFYHVIFAARPALEITLAVLIAILAGAAWPQGVHWPRPASWAYVGVMLLALVDVLFCGVFCLQGDSTKVSRDLFNLVTNLIFAGQCICVADPGVRDVVRRWCDRVRARRALDIADPDMAWLLERAK